jgi:ArsR family transcriptional regulator
MKYYTEIFQLLSDKQRLRTLMLLDNKELCVCQIMGILESSQPLISRNVALLYRAGLLEERRAGKLRYYRVSKGLSHEHKAVLEFLRKSLNHDATVKNDLKTLRECTAFQKKKGKCDMNTLKEFIRWRKRRNKKNA